MQVICLTNHSIGIFKWFLFTYKASLSRWPLKGLFSPPVNMNYHFVIIYCVRDFDRVCAFKRKLKEACPALTGRILRFYTQEAITAIEEALSHRMWVIFFKSPGAYLCSHFMTFHRRIINYSWTHNINPCISLLADEVHSRYSLCTVNIPVGVLHTYGTYLLHESDTIDVLRRRCKSLLTFSGYGRWSGYNRRCNRNKVAIYREVETEDPAEL